MVILNLILCMAYFDRSFNFNKFQLPTINGHQQLKKRTYKLVKIVIYLDLQKRSIAQENSIY